MAEFHNCSESEKYFCGTFENNEFKIISIVFASLFTPACVILLYGIIWFEKFGTDCKRTLTNKLLSSICWTLIYGLVVCSLDIIRYVIGPLPRQMCFITVIVKNAIKTQIVLFYDAILVTRYVFIFWIKNPGGVDDDFWCRFLSIWIVGFSTLLNYVIYSLPVKQPMFYFLCADIDPQLDSDKNGKQPAVVEILSVVLLIVIKLRILIQKKNNQPPEINNVFHKSYVLTMIEKQNIADFTSNLMGLLSLTGISLLSIKINSSTIVDANQFPNYLYIFFFQMGCPVLICLTVFIVNYCRCKNLRETLQRELKEHIDENCLFYTNIINRLQNSHTT
jgi:hypothetical protein